MTTRRRCALPVLVIAPVRRRFPLLYSLGTSPEQPSLFRPRPNPKVAFQVARAVQREAQRIDRLRASSTPLACPPARTATTFDELGFRRFQGQAEFSQSLAQDILDAKRIRAILETQHKVVDVPPQIG